MWNAVAEEMNLFQEKKLGCVDFFKQFENEIKNSAHNKSSKFNVL